MIGFFTKQLWHLHVKQIHSNTMFCSFPLTKGMVQTARMSGRSSLRDTKWFGGPCLQISIVGMHLSMLCIYICVYRLYLKTLRDCICQDLERGHVPRGFKIIKLDLMITTQPYDWIADAPGWRRFFVQVHIVWNIARR